MGQKHFDIVLCSIHDTGPVMQSVGAMVFLHISKWNSLDVHQTCFVLFLLAQVTSVQSSSAVTWQADTVGGAGGAKCAVQGAGDVLELGHGQNNGWGTTTCGNEDTRQR